MCFHLLCLANGRYPNQERSCEKLWVIKITQHFSISVLFLVLSVHVFLSLTLSLCLYVSLPVSLSLHRLLCRSEQAYAALRVELCHQALSDWGPTEVDLASGESKPLEFSMRWPSARYCHECKKHSFPSQLKSW